MFKKIVAVFFCLQISCFLFAQIKPAEIAFLKEKLSQAKTDIDRYQWASALAFGYRFSLVDSSLVYSDMAIAIARKNNRRQDESFSLSLKGATQLERGMIPESMELQFLALNISEEIKDSSLKAYALNRIGNIYMELAEYRRANDYYFRSMDMFLGLKDSVMYYNEISNIGNIYELMGMPDSALYYQLLVYQAAQNKMADRNFVTWAEMYFRIGNAYKVKGKTDSALQFYKKGIEVAVFMNDIRNLTMNNLFLAKLYRELDRRDSSMKYAYKAIESGKYSSFRKGIYDAAMLLSELFKDENKSDSAIRYLSMANVERDSLIGVKRFQELQGIILSEQERQREEETERMVVQNRQKQYILLGGLGIFLIIASILYRNNKQKQKANSVLESTLANLRSAQSQLVHAEKMASLGELTAGIAHEIQNPLNFVNNFSEVSKELLDEMGAELETGNIEEAKGIANSVIQNLEKISHHGKRADAIVKGMLQHSRTGTGQKEPFDLNALCDEYLRLSYHGLRAKDKTFNANFKTEFDKDLGKVNIIAQDIGRVILNLINNAFYAVAEKRKMAITGYEPVVSVSTRRVKGKAEIRVSDNGMGIPQKVLDKIFQPFFTTKPTGEGTGLGLSLSYDIVTKGHNGEIKVETKEGEGTTFVILLP